MNRHVPLVSAIALALAPVALLATTVDPYAGSVDGASPPRTQADAMAEMLSRFGLYRYSTRLQTVVVPSAPIFVPAVAPVATPPSAPPPSGDCGSPASVPAPTVEAPVAPVVFVAPVAPPVAPVPFPAEDTTPVVPSSQARLQEFFNLVLGARSKLKVVTVTAAPVVVQLPAPVMPTPVVSPAVPKSANCAPKQDEVPPAGAPGDSPGSPPMLRAELGFESPQADDAGDGQPGAAGGSGGGETDGFFDVSDPPMSESILSMRFASDGPVQFSVEPELLIEDGPGIAVPGNDVPEPGTLALLGLGLAGLGLSRRRKAH